MLNNQKKDPQRQESAGRVEIPAELVAEAKAGDQAAFTELFDLTHRAIYRTIRSMVRDEDLVWDIHQDTYLRAFKGLEKLENEASFFPWLRRIAVNVTAKTMAKRVPLPFSELGGEEDAAPELPDPNPETQPELALDRKETSRMVREILSGLPEAQQMIVGMRYYEEMRVDEIAELLGLTPGTVKTQLYRGRRRIEAAVRELGKQDVRLYGLSPLPFLLGLLRRLEPVEAAEKKTVAALTESGFRSTAVHTGRRFFETAAGRVLLGLITVGVIGGGIASWRWLQSRAEPLGDVRPTVIRMASPEDMSSEPVTTAPETTEPVTTEPEITEPETTDAKSPAPENPESPNAPTNPPESSEPVQTSGQENTAASESTGGSVSRVVSFTWEGRADQVLHDQPWGSWLCVQAVTENEVKPKVYTDNENVVTLEDQGGFHGGSLEEGQFGYHWKASFVGSGVAHVFCESGGNVIQVLTVINPDYPEMVLDCQASYETSPNVIEMDVEYSCQVKVLVQGMTKPELSTDNEEVVGLWYRGEYSGSGTSWIHRGHFWNLYGKSPGQAHVYVKLNGVVVKTYSVTLTAKEPAPPVTEAPTTEPPATEPPASAEAP